MESTQVVSKMDLLTDNQSKIPFADMNQIFMIKPVGAAVVSDEVPVQSVTQAPASVNTTLLFKDQVLDKAITSSPSNSFPKKKCCSKMMLIGIAALGLFLLRRK